VTLCLADDEAITLTEWLEGKGRRVEKGVAITSSHCVPVCIDRVVLPIKSPTFDYDASPGAAYHFRAEAKGAKCVHLG
jgi:hypothetical protein